MLARHQLGALAATAVDFTVMIVCVRAGLRPTPATALGAACGAMTNFTLGRQWIFAAARGVVGAKGPLHRQAMRYVAVSLASLGWNTVGEFVVHEVAHVQYVVARVIVSGVVGVCWNYPLHRLWVFAPPPPAGERA